MAPALSSIKPVGTLRNVLRQARLSPQEFLELL